MVFRLTGRRSQSEFGGERRSGGVASWMIRVVLLLIAAIFVAGAVFLANWEIPAPTTTVEKVISNDRFPY